MSETPVVETIAGQPSFVLSTDQIEAAITRRAAMLAPVTFHRADAPFQPYSVSPWAEEELDPETPPIIACLRGDFICSSFGGNDEPFECKQLPIHGETANEVWDLLDYETSDVGAVLRLGLDMPIQGGRCEGHTALATGHNIVYQRHDFSGVDGPINPGHHATLRFPEKPGSGRVSLSKHVFAHTFDALFENPEQGGYQCLKPNTRIDDLAAVPRLDGTTADVTVYPARRGFEDLVLVCADPSLEIAWSTVTFHEEGAVWFALRDPKVFPSTTLWMSNAGRHYAPWNGRHHSVMGVEDMIGLFPYGLAASARDNLLTENGFPTCHRPAAGETLRAPYLQGVARVPEGFDRVASVEIESDDTILLVAESGVRQAVPCHARFATTGELPGLI